MKILTQVQTKHAKVFCQRTDFPFLFLRDFVVRPYTITLRYKLQQRLLTNIVQHNTTMKYTLLNRESILNIHMI